jgi:hypothetical protein
MKKRISGSPAILLCGLLGSSGRGLRGRHGRRCAGLLVAGLALSAPAQEEFDLQRYFDWKIAICCHIALFENGGEVWARGYRIPGRPSKQFQDWEIFNAPLHSLEGQR